MSAVLQVRGLTVELGPSAASGGRPVHVVDDASLVLARGEALGIVGESGSGKSTLLYALLGLLPTSMRQVSGDIVFDGRNLGLLASKVRRNLAGSEIGVVFQEPTRSLNPLLRVGEQIAEVLRCHKSLNRKAAWSRAVELLDEVGIERASLRARDYPHQLSGGMNQRVMIAMAIACSPALLVADEPTTALDVTVQHEIMELFARLRVEHNMAILFVTHDLALIQNQVDRVAVMYAGRIVEHGLVGDVFGAPRHPYTSALLDCQPSRASALSPMREIGGSIPSIGDRPSGCAFHPRCTFAKERCADETPRLVAESSNHERACFYPLSDAEAAE